MNPPPISEEQKKRNLELQQRMEEEGIFYDSIKIRINPIRDKRQKENEKIMRQLREGKSYGEIYLHNLLEEYAAKEAKRKKISERLELAFILFVILATAVYLILQHQGIIR